MVAGSVNSNRYIPEKNPSINRNSLIFAILMIITEIIIAVMHGVYARPVNAATAPNYIAMSLQNLIPFVLAVLVIAGFGLIFSYNKKLIWSGIGFTFFITAVVIQLYPLINAFWLKTQILTQSSTTFQDADKTFTIQLTNF